MVEQFAQQLCILAKPHELIRIESERDGATIAARDFSGREPAEIANFAIVENSKGRDVFARLGGSLIKSSEGARMPFLGSVRYPYDGGAPELVGAPRPDPNLSKAHPLTSEPKSFLRMKGFA